MRFLPRAAALAFATLLSTLLAPPARSETPIDQCTDSGSGAGGSYTCGRMGRLGADLVRDGQIAEVVIGQTLGRGIPTSNPEEVEPLRDGRVGYRVTLDPREYGIQATGPGGEIISDFHMPWRESVEHAGGHITGMRLNETRQQHEQRALNWENQYRANTRPDSGITRTMANQQSGVIDRTGRLIDLPREPIDFILPR